MSQADLNTMERDVEQARAKLRSNLTRLQSPAALSAFKEDLRAEAHQVGNALAEKTKKAAADGAQSILADLKARAAANPAAALAIGAGLAWRLIHRPPIASALVGIGLFSLLRTPASAQPYMDLDDEDPKVQRYDEAVGNGGVLSRATELADSVVEKVQDWGSSAGDATRETVSLLTDKASSAADATRGTVLLVAEKASGAADTTRETVSLLAEKASGAADATRETISLLADKAATAAARTSEIISDAMPDEDARDKYLLGAAAVAVVAALGIAYQRRNQDEGRA